MEQSFCPCWPWGAAPRAISSFHYGHTGTLPEAERRKWNLRLDEVRWSFMLLIVTCDPPGWCSLGGGAACAVGFVLLTGCPDWPDEGPRHAAPTPQSLSALQPIRIPAGTKSRTTINMCGCESMFFNSLILTEACPLRHTSTDLRTVQRTWLVGRSTGKCSAVPAPSCHAAAWHPGSEVSAQLCRQGTMAVWSVVPVTGTSWLFAEEPHTNSAAGVRTLNCW